MLNSLRSTSVAFALRPFRAWKQFLFDAHDALPLAVLRVLFGAYLVYYYAALYPLLDIQFFPPALLPPSALSTLSGPLLIRYVGYGFMPRLALYGLTMLAAVALALGIQTRLAAPLVWLLQRSWLSFDAGHNSGDNVLMITAFLLAVSALFGYPQRVLSVDAWLHSRERRTAPSPFIPAWPLRLIQVQLVYVYWFTGIHKLSAAEWYTGEALFYVFQQPVWSRFDLSSITGVIPIALISYGTLLFEVLLFPTLVWVRAARPYVLIAGVAFHLGIVFTMRVFVFSEAMLLCYLSFVNPRSLLRRAYKAFLRRRSSREQRAAIA